MGSPVVSGTGEIVETGVTPTPTPTPTADANSYCYSDAHTNPHTDAYANPDTYSHADAEPNSDTYSHTDSNSDPHAYAHPVRRRSNWVTSPRDLVSAPATMCSSVALSLLEVRRKRLLSERSVHPLGSDFPDASGSVSRNS